MKEEIGMFFGKEINEMDREQLLGFASWAAKRIQELEKIEESTQDFRLGKEVINNLK